MFHNSAINALVYIVLVAVFVWQVSKALDKLLRDDIGQATSREDAGEKQTYPTVTLCKGTVLSKDIGAEEGSGTSDLNGHLLNERIENATLNMFELLERERPRAQILGLKHGPRDLMNLTSQYQDYYTTSYGGHPLRCVAVSPPEKAHIGLSNQVNIDLREARQHYQVHSRHYQVDCTRQRSKSQVIRSRFSF